MTNTMTGAEIDRLSAPELKKRQRLDLAAGYYADGASLHLAASMAGCCHKTLRAHLGDIQRPPVKKPGQSYYIAEREELAYSHRYRRIIRLMPTPQRKTNGGECNDSTQ